MQGAAAPHTRRPHARAGGSSSCKNGQPGKTKITYETHAGAMFTERDVTGADVRNYTTPS
jgi:hypothetical protein